ncbi:hypothetical protein EA796_06755 [Pseudomonas sp. AOB-7]|uniref:hypothetical protein n=1 Tax=Pseudomonas sp. AOB-7 TaxID=2482750 RepID=UPI000EFC83D2|nr:hypothetical protein [Pseudomonas sp. AOB-7]RMH85203.1 hypothetical protein EA796_06755 [Pseudomonas sp. AOB-7]
MTMIRRSIDTPIRTDLDWHTTWKGEDKGLIKCWEVGRQLAQSKPELAEAAGRDELPVTNWKGGVSRTLKKLDKYGALKYLAQWQGLRGEDLAVDLAREVTITCSKTGMVVTFTPDVSKFLDQTTEDAAEGDEQDGRSAPGISEQSLFS